jgi:hypothetical protein
MYMLCTDMVCFMMQGMLVYILCAVSVCWYLLTALVEFMLLQSVSNRPCLVMYRVYHVCVCVCVCQFVSRVCARVFCVVCLCGVCVCVCVCVCTDVVYTHPAHVTCEHPFKHLWCVCVCVCVCVQM